MPRHPRSIDKWNYIVDFFTDPCDAPFSIYVKTLYPAVMEALVTYYAIDVMQIFTSFVAPGGGPKGARGGRHGGGYKDPDVERRKRGNGRGGVRTWSKRWRVWTGFDPSDWLGSKAAEFFQGGTRGITPGVSTMWNLYGLEQRAVYWIFLAELVEQFFYKWSSGVAASFYCQEQYRPWCLATSPSCGKLGVVFEDALTMDTVAKSRGVSYAAGNLIALQGKGSTCVFSGKYDGPSGESGNFLRIRHQSGLTIDGPTMAGSGQIYTVSGSAQEPGGWHFYGCGPTRYTMLDVDFNVVGSQAVYGPNEG